jgi:UDP-N-acetylglucosamine transferase subunit ALG13
MIFVTVGTHPGQFDRLIKKIDNIAPGMKNKVVIQKGFTKYTPKNCKYFEFTDNIDEYFNKSNIVISHAATSILEFSLKYRKPLIIVPRQKKYKEHLNDHQLEFAEYYAKKTGVDFIIDIDKINAKYLNSYRKIPKIDVAGLKIVQNNFKKVFKIISTDI